MRKRICALALTSVFLCACLSGCSESSQPNAPASNSNNSYSSSTSDNNSSSSSESKSDETNDNSNSSTTTKKDAISTRLDKISHERAQTGKGVHVLGRDGVWRWEYAYTYQLHVYITVKNTGDYRAKVNSSNFSAYWDSSRLANSGTVFDATYNENGLAPGAQTTIKLIYDISEYQYNSWNTPGHNITLGVQYGNRTLAYVYSTDTGSVKAYH